MYLGISRRFNFRETAGIGWWSKWPLSSNEKRLLSLPRKGERCYQSLGSRKGSNFNMYRRTDTQSALYLTPDCKHITKQTLTGNAATSSVLSNNRLPIRLREQTAAPPASPHSTSTVETPPHVSRMCYDYDHSDHIENKPWGTQHPMAATGNNQNRYAYKRLPWTHNEVWVIRIHIILYCLLLLLLLLLLNLTKSHSFLRLDKQWKTAKARNASTRVPK